MAVTSVHFLLLAVATTAGRALATTHLFVDPSVVEPNGGTTL